MPPFKRVRVDDPRPAPRPPAHTTLLAAATDLHPFRRGRAGSLRASSEPRPTVLRPDHGWQSEQIPPRRLAAVWCAFSVETPPSLARTKSRGGKPPCPLHSDLVCERAPTQRADHVEVVRALNMRPHVLSACRADTHRSFSPGDRSPKPCSSRGFEMRARRPKSSAPFFGAGSALCLSSEERDERVCSLGRQPA